MERKEALKEIGFSDEFLEKLDQFDQANPETVAETSFFDSKPVYLGEYSESFIITHTSNNYSNNPIIVTNKQP